MGTECIREYIDFLNTLTIIFENDNMRFKVTRKNHICSSNQLGIVFEKNVVSIAIDGIAYPFSTVLVNPVTQSMRIKYDDFFIDEILMCLREEYKDFYELGINEIHYHINNFEKPYFTDMIHRLIVKQKKKKVKQALLGMMAREVRNSVIYYSPTWAIDVEKTISLRRANETVKAIRTLVSDLYDERIGQSVPIRYAKIANAYEIFSRPNSDFEIGIRTK